ncbi:MAG: hypothetical protein HY874_07945 [Chloroflexi bacterium]|nr:hypothetical protein [Chloroflexota bacterium]
MQLRSRPNQAPAPFPLRIVAPGEAPSGAADLARNTYVISLMGAIAIGVVIRFALVLSSDFPLNDGGLFFGMARDIQASGYALPEFASYNHRNIPFGYPPLSLYLAALVDDATPMSLVQVFRFLPLLASCGTIPAFFLLARSMLGSRRAVVIATALFALLPPGFMWMIMGGGLTRASGFLFALLALHQVHEMHARRQLWRSLPAGIFSALTLMSHLEMAWLVAFSSLLFAIAYARDSYGIRSSLLVGAVGGALSAPWWATVIAYHGPGPLLAAAHSGSYPLAGVFALVEYGPTIEPLFAMVAGLALLGGFACVANRRYLLPVWVLAGAALDGRAFATSATIPVALLAAIGVQDVLLPLITHHRLIQPSLSPSAGAGDRAPSGAPSWLAGAVLSIVIAYAILEALVASPKLLTGLKAPERDAMAWVAASTPADSRFLIVTESRWPVDRTAEWFPALTGRQAILTVQGTEWLPDDAFNREIAEYRGLQTCGQRLVDCVDEWVADTGKTYDYMYFPKIDARVDKPEDGPCCISLRGSVARDDRFTQVFDGPGAVIYRFAN